MNNIDNLHCFLISIISLLASTPHTFTLDCTGKNIQYSANKNAKFETIREKTTLYVKFPICVTMAGETGFNLIHFHIKTHPSNRSHCKENKERSKIEKSGNLKSKDWDFLKRMTSLKSKSHRRRT